MSIILQHKIIMSVVLVLFLSGTIIQLLLSHFYSVLIAETENMATTEVELLFQCKRKFSNCYRLHNGVLNVFRFHMETFFRAVNLTVYFYSRIRRLYRDYQWKNYRGNSSFLYNQYV